MTDTNRPLRVFLCHSSADKPVVRELYQKLRAEKWLQPWLDEEELYPGQDWNLEIEKAIEDTDVIIVCLSDNSITKEGYVQKEIKKALDFADYKPDGTVFIIPVRLEECKPPIRLTKWQYADYFAGQHERGYERLLISLRRRADSLGFVSSKKQLPQKEKKSAVETLKSIIESNHPNAKLLKENKIVLANNMEFMYVPAGSYATGNEEQRFIEIPYNYWMGRFLVTNENYYEYVKSKAKKHPVSNWMNRKDHPVVFVSWLDAIDYSNWLNSQFRQSLPDGMLLRLPIRFEWEKAARGVSGRSYPWGYEFDKSKCNSWESSIRKTTPVGTYSPIGDSPYDCSDMWGNVRVWAQEATKFRVPGIPDNADVRVTCGISYLNAGKYSVHVDSFGMPAEFNSRTMGFRLVIAPPIPK